MEPDRPQHGHPVTCDIAQQYSSPTILLRFHYRKEKFGTRFNKMLLFKFFYFLKIG